MATYKEGDLLWVKSLARRGIVNREVDDGLYLVSILLPDEQLIPEADLSAHKWTKAEHSRPL